MEDSPHFNAGHGATLNEAGFHELDASIMDGATLSAGAVTLVRHVRNPIMAARAVLERSEAVFLGGEAADLFARDQGIATRAELFHHGAAREGTRDDEGAPGGGRAGHGERSREARDGRRRRTRSVGTPGGRDFDRRLHQQARRQNRR
jgi:isoaspartyl peptidase/L-asparaginase-like protein (Ntn-hydrolase superfamily)